MIKKNPKLIIFTVGFVACLAITLVEVLRGRAENFCVYRDATLNFWNGISSYSDEFVKSHDGRFFLYSPLFNVIFTPFAFLPKIVGALLYNLMNYTVLILGIYNLPKQIEKHIIKIALFLLIIIEESIFCFQYNLVVLNCFLWAYILLEKKQNFWAVFIIMLSATTKVYGAIELGLLFCYPKVWKNFGYALLCGLFLLLLPGLHTGVAGLPECYAEWFSELAKHQESVKYVSIIYAAPFDRWFMPNLRLVQLTTVILLIIGFLLSHKKWQNWNFRIQVLGVMMGWVILFGDCSETHTYVIALCGYLMCYYTWNKRHWCDRLLYWLCFITFCIIPSDIFCPTNIHDFVNHTLWLNVYCYTLVWVKMVYKALTLDNPLEPVVKHAE